MIFVSSFISFSFIFFSSFVYKWHRNHVGRITCLRGFSPLVFNLMCFYGSAKSGNIQGHVHTFLTNAHPSSWTDAHFSLELCALKGAVEGGPQSEVRLNSNPSSASNWLCDLGQITLLYALVSSFVKWDNKST